MTKRIASLILAFVLVFVGSIAVNAEVTDNAVQPRYSYTSSTVNALTISNGVATCSAQLTGYSNVTKIRITMTLQKKGLLWWNEVDTWTATYYQTYAVMSKTADVNSGKYRVKVEFTVTAGSNSEDITTYSPEKEC